MICRPTQMLVSPWFPQHEAYHIFELDFGLSPTIDCGKHKFMVRFFPQQDNLHR